MASINMAYIGGGFASTVGVYEFLAEIRRLREKEISQSSNFTKLDGLNIHIYDKGVDKFGGGKAFDSSDPSFLYNNTFSSDILERPKDDLHRMFYVWLRENSDYWIDKIKSKNNPALNSWLEKHENEVRTHNFDDVFIPRFIFGIFLDGVLDKEINAAKKLGMNLKFLNASVSGITKTPDDQFSLNFEHSLPEEVKIVQQKDQRDYEFVQDSTKKFHAPSYNFITYALGFPPGLNIDNLAKNERFLATHLDESTKIGTKMRKLKEQVTAIYNDFSNEEKAAGKKVCIGAIGVGPSFMDFVHYCDDSELASMVSITGFSGSGKLPVSAARTYVNGQPYKAELLVAENQFQTPEDISAAVNTEAIKSKAAGYTDADVIACLKEMLSAMKDQNLANNYRGSRYIPDANKLGVTAPESAAVGDKLLHQGILQLVKSRVNPTNIVCPEKDSPFEVKFGDKQETAKFDILMNFVGPGKLTNNNLIKDAAEKGLIKLAIDPESQTEVVNVKSCRETSKGVYCLGAMSFNSMVDDHMQRKAGAGTCIEHAKLAAKEVASQVMEMAKMQNQERGSAHKRSDSWPEPKGYRASLATDSPTRTETGSGSFKDLVNRDKSPSEGRNFTGIR